MKTTIYTAIALISLIIYSSCSSRRIDKDMTSSSNTRIEEGRLVFKYQCQKCHPNGESGVGPPLNNIKLPGFLIRARVRSRAFLLWTGRMPAFNKHEISKKEMNALIAYIKYMEKENKKKN
jgi:mono/diheme cytochrome c family protein